MKVLLILLLWFLSSVENQPVKGTLVERQDTSGGYHRLMDPSYRERLQSWGLYPKVFRYGTTNHRAIIKAAKQNELHLIRRLVREHESNGPSHDRRMHLKNASRQTDTRFDRLKDHLLQKMEQDALEILWQH
ncbi:hypothetical protein AND_000493 [Anopheles darlingi]|uniref:Secreted protein n=1 Tax=Anopheles darlingi TaxID=43151 RepID=W5JWY8_ANODA|nr:hypothetical protein AND_000493 [Anopheles darlingi]